MRLSSVALCALVTLAPIAARAQSDFALKSGDRVVFYGDSITDQREYTLFTEQFVVTRFPDRAIRFVHSGWGGDRVGGGGGGPIDVRLDRDVTPYRPTVVTVMLGMNDAAYRPFDQGIFDTYSSGYRHLVEKVQKDNPGVRMTLIQPSPYDDVTRAPGFADGYNAVLIRYGQFIGQLAREKGASVADLNTPVVAMLNRANAANATLAQKIVPDRVHPDWGGHLIMAEALLKAWNAPSLVSSVHVDAASKTADTQNAEVTGLKAGEAGTLTWTALERALPFPMGSPNPNPDSAAAFQLALASSDFVQALNQETLTVSGLSEATYTLQIDGKPVGDFTREQLAAGINLATLPTPMASQAQLVAQLTRLRANLHNSRWREIQVPRAGDAGAAPLLPAAIKAMDAAGDDLYKAQHDAAKPRAHSFALVPKR